MILQIFCALDSESELDRGRRPRRRIAARHGTESTSGERVRGDPRGPGRGPGVRPTNYAEPQAAGKPGGIGQNCPPHKTKLTHYRAP